MGMGRRRELFIFGYELVRLFQNAVSSGQSFIEHSLTSVRRRYKGHAFLAEFEAAHQSRLVKIPICQFVKAIRHFQLHNQAISPVFSNGLSNPFDGSMPMSQVLLSTAELRAERERWKRNYPRAVEYLDSLGSSIDVRVLIVEYQNHLAKFRRWHRSTERELNATTLRRAEQLRAEINRISPVVGSYLVSLDADDDHFA
jgi:hypothetical protein